MPRPPAPKGATATKAAPAGPPMGLIGGVTALVVALVAVLIYLVARGDGTEAAGSADALPEGGGVLINADAPADAVDVHIFEDFQCPFCGVLEQSAGSAFEQAAEDGTIRLTYTFMSFLDRVSDNESSSRAANAALCANDAGVLPQWHSAAYAAQPQEGVGYTDNELTGFAEQAGLSGAELNTFNGCVAGETYADYVDDMQEAANREGVTGTPTVLVDGEPLDQETLQQLQADPASLQDIIRAGQ